MKTPETNKTELARAERFKAGLDAIIGAATNGDSALVREFADLSCHYLRDMAAQGNKYAISALAKVTVDMTETMDELLSGEPDKIRSNAKVMQWLASDLPYWPMLHHLHAAGNNHFPLVADALRLGADCSVNIDPAAKYSLQTPVNRLVWRLLRRFQDVHGHIELNKREGMTAEATLRFYDASERRIFKCSYKLKRLTKANAAQWADKVIMKLVQARYPDFSAVPVLKRILDKCDPRPKSPKAESTAIRKAVIQSLRSLAPAQLDKIHSS